jgi:hypothetical protein
MGLTFLTPWLLAGAALVVVPIVLHLIMRRQPKHLLFPAMRFIQLREEANRRQLRLRHLLLLLLRCAAIVLLALALARPSLKSAGIIGDQEAPIAAALVFDNSVRMDYQNENKTRLVAAQEIAEWLLPQLPRESEIAVVDRSSLAPAFAVDTAAARQRVEKLTTVAAAQPWLEVVESAMRLVNDSEKERKEVYLFSDLSQSSWPTEVATRFKSRLEEFPDVAIYLIDVGVLDPRNFALGDMTFASETVAKNAPVRIETQLARTGPGEERAVALYLVGEDGAMIKRDERTFGWIGEQSLPADFELGGLDLGVHQGVLKLVGDDALAADNARYFTIDVRPAWKVLIAAPAPVEETALFLSQAIAPDEWRRTGQSRFEVTTVAIGQLPQTNLDEYAAVCVLDPPPLEHAMWDKLNAYVKQGGGLGIWLGRGALENLQAFHSAAALEVLPGRLVRAAGSSEDLFLAPADQQHPVLRGFRSKQSEVPWAEFPVYKYWQLGEIDEGINTIIPFNNDRPALVEQAIGRGRVLTMTTPVSESASERDCWNQIATGSGNWPFMALSNEMLFYLVGRSDQRANFFCGDSVVMNVPDKHRESVFTLRTPEDLTVPQTVDQRSGSVTITTTQAPGNYQLRAGGSQSGVNLGFSANVPGDATALERVTRDELSDLLGAERFRLARSREEITRDVNLGRVGTELYPLLILLVAVVLGLEHLIANRFYRRDTSVAVEVPRPASLAESKVEESQSGSVGPPPPPVPPTTASMPPVRRKPPPVEVGGRG